VLTRLSNTPRDYAWGSTTLIAELEGRAPSDSPEAEVWLGDHPGSPSLVDDGSGRTLDQVRTERLPYLLKLLAAASALSIQAHPSKAQAEEGFAREDAEGLARDAGSRNYRDDNHKPEVIVALRDGFEALSGLRDLTVTRRLLAELGPAAAELRERLEGGDADDALRRTIAWLLSGDAASTVTAIVEAAATIESAEFAAELAITGRLAASSPADPGIVVALLMNLVVLRRGEALFVPAGIMHAYLSGIGVEIMAASDNVLRGGLTPKHIDVAELLHVLDASSGPAVLLQPSHVAPGVERFAPGVPDFALLRVEGDAAVTTSGAAVALCTAGDVEVRGAGGTAIALRPGQALYADAGESPLRVSGAGELFIAEPGA
jgi:mannose-6-phosphate isomerase